MSKKKDKKVTASDIYVGKKSDPVKMVAEFTGKKGKIGKNKKGKNRFFRSICMHHRPGKKGIPKPAVFKSHDDVATCKICGEKMPTVPYDENEVRKIVKDFEYLNQQNKFMSVACGCDTKLQRFFAETGIVTGWYIKNATALAKVAKKQNKNKKKKKKNGGGSYEYGSWAGGR